MCFRNGWAHISECMFSHVAAPMHVHLLLQSNNLIFERPQENSGVAVIQEKQQSNTATRFLPVAMVILMTLVISFIFIVHGALAK